MSSLTRRIQRAKARNLKSSIGTMLGLPARQKPKVHAARSHKRWRDEPRAIPGAGHKLILEESNA